MTVWAMYSAGTAVHMAPIRVWVNRVTVVGSAFPSHPCIPSCVGTRNLIELHPGAESKVPRLYASRPLRLDGQLAWAEFVSDSSIASGLEIAPQRRSAIGVKEMMRSMRTCCYSEAQGDGQSDKSHAR